MLDLDDSRFYILVSLAKIREILMIEDFRELVIEPYGMEKRILIDIPIWFHYTGHYCPIQCCRKDGRWMTCYHGHNANTYWETYWNNQLETYVDAAGYFGIKYEPPGDYGHVVHIRDLVPYDRLLQRAEVELINLVEFDNYRFVPPLLCDKLDQIQEARRQIKLYRALEESQLVL